MYGGFLYPVARNAGVRLTDIAGNFQALVAVMVTGAFYRRCIYRLHSAGRTFVVRVLTVWALFASVGLIKSLVLRQGIQPQIQVFF